VSEFGLQGGFSFIARLEQDFGKDFFSHFNFLRTQRMEYFEGVGCRGGGIDDTDTKSTIFQRFLF
jgi:hypothetical protein